MVCYNPLLASVTLDANGKRTYHVLGSMSSLSISGSYNRLAPNSNVIQVPCGQCLGCRLHHADEWALRCIHEARMHRFNSFVTLTYSDEHLPPDSGLYPDDVTLFLKRLRFSYGKFRYIYSGEYGERLLRPHYHLLLFGYWPSDARLFSIADRAKVGYKLFRSPSLERIWGKGYVTVGSVNFLSSRYVAKYSLKKLVHNDNFYDSLGLRREFIRCSLKPGIGADFYNLYRDSIYSHDYCIVDGLRKPVPRYYDKLLERDDPALYDHIKELRISRASAMPTFEPDRFIQLESLANHRQSLFNRCIDSIS